MVQKKVIPTDLYHLYLSSKEEVPAKLSVRNVPFKGRAVFAESEIMKDDYVVEYKGELVTSKVAKSREKLYEGDQSKGCYMYYFKVDGKNYCIDATEEDNSLGRIINHSINDSNVKAKSAVVEGKPRLFFIATKDIGRGEEVLVDYGDRRKDVMEENPWLKS
jgi:histone-lysine N-methyltransferase SETD8